MKKISNTSNKSLFETILQLALIFLIMAFCIKLIGPFVMPILWAVILAVILYPLHNWLQHKLNGRKKLSASIITVFILGLISIPAISFFSSVTSSIYDIVSHIYDGTLQISAPSENIKQWPLIGGKVFELLTSLSQNLEKGLTEYKDEIIEASKTILSGLVSSGITFLQIILAVIISGVLLVSEEAKKTAESFILKIAGNKGEEIITISLSTVHQVVKGVIGVAVIQTIVQGFGLYMSGVPFAGILTLLCLIFSILQIGPILVNIGVIAYLFSTGDNTYAIFWTIFFVLNGLSDNILKPMLLGKGALVPILVIFIGVIGGFMMSGFIGLFVGPIVFSIGYKLFMAWLGEVDIDLENDI